MNLHNYDLVVINTSGGKDSVCAIWEVCRLAEEQGYPKEKIILSHQELKGSEWPDSKKVVTDQAKYFGLELIFSKRRKDQVGGDTLLGYVMHKQKWPDGKRRWCTSDFKRDVGAKVVRRLANTLKKGKTKILQVFGFRKEESPEREKKRKFSLNRRLSCLNRKVFDWLPVHSWKVAKVWKTIKAWRLPMPYAYKLGMGRFSCFLCIFMTFDAAVISAKANPDGFAEYLAVQRQVPHSFRIDYSLEDVKRAIDEGYEPKKSNLDWKM